jgi:hypothetical protein
VEGTGVFKSASRELEDGENNNTDVVVSESILAEGIGMSAVVVF